MTQRKHVAVLMGGWSAERPVSLNSGRECADNLEQAGYRVTRKPACSSASAHSLPEFRLTGRSADQPPISTATCSFRAITRHPLTNFRFAEKRLVRKLVRKR